MESTKNIELWNDCFDSMAENEYESKSLGELEEIYKDWLQERSLKCKETEIKASAYDRLMSGGVITKKDVANVFGKVLVMTPNGYWQLWFSKPRRDKWGWHLDGGDTKSIGHTIAHFSDLNIIHDGSWRGSLTLPDGWEE